MSREYQFLRRLYLIIYTCKIYVKEVKTCSLKINLKNVAGFH